MIDWPHMAVTAAGFIATIAVIKTDIRWIKQWMRDHDKKDDHRFEKLETRLQKS